MQLVFSLNIFVFVFSDVVQLNIKSSLTVGDKLDLQFNIKNQSGILKPKVYMFLKDKEIIYDKTDFF